MSEGVSMPNDLHIRLSIFERHIINYISLHRVVLYRDITMSYPSILRTSDMAEMTFMKRSPKMKKKSKSSNKRLHNSQIVSLSSLMPLSRSMKQERSSIELSRILNKHSWRSLKAAKPCSMFSRKRTAHWQRESSMYQQERLIDHHKLSQKRNHPLQQQLVQVQLMVQAIVKSLSNLQRSQESSIQQSNRNNKSSQWVWVNKVAHYKTILLKKMMIDNEIYRYICALTWLLIDCLIN